MSAAASAPRPSAAPRGPAAPAASPVDSSVGASAGTPASDAAAARRRRWTRLARWGGLAFTLVVVGLLVHIARAVQWGEVWFTVQRYEHPTLLAAAGFVAASFAVYSSFDVLARRYAGHALPAGRTALIGFISYAFNLSLGNVIGGVGVRVRLYTRLGLDGPTVSRVLAFAVATNWLGYVLLIGLLFATQSARVPPGWPLSDTALAAVGAAGVALIAAYVVWCAVARKRMWLLRGHAVELPPLRLALAQLAASVLNWSLMGAAVWVLLHGEVRYLSVLSVLMLGAVAGVVMRVPAGLGVLEGVFVALLGHRVPHNELLAALLAYRALYYLAPLVLAALLYAHQEATARRLRRATVPAH